MNAVISIIMRVIFGLMLLAGVAVSIMVGIQAYSHGAGFDNALGSAAFILVVFVIVISFLMMITGRLWGTRHH